MTVPPNMARMVFAKIRYTAVRTMLLTRHITTALPTLRLALGTSFWHSFRHISMQYDDYTQRPKFSIISCGEIGTVWRSQSFNQSLFHRNFGDASMARLDSVSYTHLDVYKRQEFLRPRFEAVERKLTEGLGDTGCATWTHPRGG